MASVAGMRVLTEALPTGAGAARRLALQAGLVVLGIAALAVAAKIKVPFWPVPMTLQTLVVLSIGTAYGMRLGGITLLGYLALGALGADVFTSSSATDYGLAYMMGATGGYLAGFLLAALAMGALARAGWDRSIGTALAAMLAGQILIFLPGVLWLGALFAADQGWAWVIEHGLVTFLPAEALKLAIAAMLFPMAWRALGEARR